MIPKSIRNPYHVNYYIYSVLFALAAFLFLKDRTDNLLLNLGSGFFTSTLVALLIDLANVKDKNRKFNSTYDAVYNELKFKIRWYIESWARVCKIAFKNKPFIEEAHTWTEWFDLSKKYFFECNEIEKKEHFSFILEQTQGSMNEVADSVNNLLNQSYLLRINDVINFDLDKILTDYQFEFNVDLKLHTNSYEEFWEIQEALKKDIEHYISNWVDISYYNYIKFKPWQINENGGFFDSKEIIRAMEEAKKASSLSK